MDLEEEKFTEIETQLSCPNGEKGKEVGDMMHATNIGMTLAAIENLCIKDDDAVLELGHGNAMHLKELFLMADRLKYFGLDVSDLMHKEAQLNALEIIGETVFKLYDGINIPFKDGFFNKIFTVNTIYFWEEPIHLLKEIYRVLKSNGIVVIAYAQKDFMQQLPFVKSKFVLYNNIDMQELISKTDFSMVKIIDKQEVVKNKIGEKVVRDFSVAILRKND